MIIAIIEVTPGYPQTTQKLSSSSQISVSSGSRKSATSVRLETQFSCEQEGPNRKGSVNINSM